MGRNDIKNKAGVYNGFAINAGKEVCEFIRLDTNEQIGCRVDSETSSVVSGQEAIVYVLRPTVESLADSIQYEVRLTSQKYSYPNSP